ncbi:MAG: hypothetical protein FJ271_19700 [Planctomycetes bacterium]|nr:hypothetical protein [Planctomycetota bacterium]
MSVVRPGAVTAAGVLAIIYGGLFSLCGLVGVAGMAAQGGMGKNMFGGGDPNQEKFQKELDKQLDRDAPGFQAYQMAGTVIGLAAALALLIGGIGLFSMHRWARKLTLVAALGTILLSAIQTIYTVVYIIPAMNNAFQVAVPAMVQQKGAGLKEQDALRLVETMVTLMIVGIIVVYVLIMVYLFIIVVLLSRQHVRAAFAGEAPAWSDAETERLGDYDRGGPEREDDGWGASGPPRNPEDDFRYR